MEANTYTAPMCEEMELVLEGAVLASSIPDLGDGGDLFALS